jgi:hypothetical protein
MRTLRHNCIPAFLLALLALTVGPALAALTMPCAVGHAAAHSVACACLSSTAAQTPAPAGDAACGRCATHASETTPTEDPAATAPTGAACLCALSDGNQSPAATPPSPLRAESLLGAALTPALLPVAVVAAEAPRFSTFTHTDEGHVPGSQHESRPDVGRAPPAR